MPSALVTVVLSALLFVPSIHAKFKDCPSFPFRNTSLSYEERVQVGRVQNSCSDVRPAQLTLLLARITSTCLPNTGSREQDQHQ